MDFNLPRTDLLEVHGEYSLPIVALSIFIACITSFTALTLNKSAQKNGFLHQHVWLVIGAITLGFGIWSTHFIGMVAFSFPVETHYDRSLTVLSVIPAMLASFLAFYIANLPKKSLWTYGVAGVVMGLGISTMHYVGMIAMKSDASTVYDKWLFIASIIIAILFSIFAIMIFSTLKDYMENRFHQLIAATIMGLAVSGMHYTGMVAMSFYVPLDYSFPSSTAHVVKMSLIIACVAVGIILLLGLQFLSNIVNRYLDYRTNNFDTLTMLPNRRQFEGALGSSTAYQTLAIWHFHNLEKVNREEGYLFGDKVIQEASALLISLTPAMTDLYRIEGNRFAFLMKKSGRNKDFQESMKNISQRLKQPLEIHSDKDIMLPAICAWQTSDKRIEISTIYSNVLAVLNYPSIKYNHEVVHYDPKVHTYAFEREIATGIERAMRDELYLVYQPKVNGRTYEITGIETLLRWRHPDYGLLSPNTFIPILEENDRMLDVTDWVIEKACSQISTWLIDGISFGQVAINIPGQYVTSSRLLKVLKRTLKKNNLEPNMVELEITERSFVKNIEEAIRAVSVFRQAGFSVALDDFGTGVSSLSYLRKIPITTLKIDKSFVDEVPKSKKDSSIIQAIIALGRSLDLSVIFEGVETEEQAKFLALTCEHPIIQGYYFAKPMKAEDLVEWGKTFRHQKLSDTFSYEN